MGCKQACPGIENKSLTGRGTDKMTAHYYHLNLNDMQDVRQIQEGIFSAPNTVNFFILPMNLKKNTGQNKKSLGHFQIYLSKSFKNSFLLIYPICLYIEETLLF